MKYLETETELEGFGGKYVLTPEPTYTVEGLYLNTKTSGSVDIIYKGDNFFKAAWKFKKARKSYDRVRLIYK